MKFQSRSGPCRSGPLIGLLSAEFLSLLGNQIAAVAIPLLVLEQTHSPIAVGFAGAGNVLPIAFSALVGGRVIDRYGALKTSIFSDLISGVSVAVLPLVLLAFSNVSPLVIFLLVFIGALFDPTGIAARQTLVPKLARLSGQSLVKVNSYRGTLEHGADLLGPAIGAGFMSLIGIINTFFLNAASFLLCAIILAVSIPLKRRIGLNKEKLDLLVGIRFIFQHNQLKVLTLVGAIANFVLLPFLGLLLPVLLTEKFANPLLFGPCLSIFGITATCGAVLFPSLDRVSSRSTIYYGGLLMAAGSIALCAGMKTGTGIILAVGLAGLLLGAGNPLEQTLLQKVVPHRIAGQVFTAHQSIRFVFGPLGLLLAGMLIEFSTVEMGLICGSVVLSMTAVVGWWIAPLMVVPDCSQ